LENIVNERILILAFNIKTGENNIDQVRDFLSQGLYLTDLLFVVPAGYIMTFKSSTEPNPYIAQVRVNSEIGKTDRSKISEDSILSRTLEKYSFMMVSDEKTSGK